ncbi:VOC family protein [Bacillus sp. MCCB 382]|uniref:VOC family protein n=1 Tax=Bacillus sp. MCCB 382 TaxID=2860197 RepID=UPI001C59DF67|nr:VOC family protein [Bacillus sp. MCCB 382]
MFERIDTICLTVSNLEQSSKWYQELGFNVSFSGVGYQIFTVGNGGVPFTIEEGNVSSKESSIYPIFFSSNIKDTYLKLKEKGIKVTDINDDGDNTYFDFYDLDDNRMQVCYWE